MNIKYSTPTENGIDYIGDTGLSEKTFGKLMKEICEEKVVSIFWQLKRNGEFFISLDYTPAKICTGGMVD